LWQSAVGEVSDRVDGVVVCQAIAGKQEPLHRPAAT
jgi:hypothetical protein